MRAIQYASHGDPARVLELTEVPEPHPPAPGDALIRVLARPVHPCDLTGVGGRAGSAKAATPGGTRPGLEGVGLVEALGPGVDDRLAPGMRVAFFPARSAWSERVLAHAAYVTPVPDDISDEIAAQLHVMPLTAVLLLHAAEAACLHPDGHGVVVLTAAGSAVAKLATALAVRRGLKVINVVRRDAGVPEVAALHRDVPVISTEESGWRKRLLAAADGHPIRAVLDPVGGELASDMIPLLAEGGALVPYGDLSGEPIRVPALSFATHDIHIRGVSVGRWASRPACLRADDIATAIALARHRPELFPVAGAYDLSRIAEAVGHAGTARGGAVLLTSC